MLTLEKSKPFSPKKSIFSTILAKVCFTNWCQRYPNAKVVTRWHNTCQVNRLRKMAPVDTLGTIAVRCEDCHLRVWDVTCLASEAHKTKPHESSVEFIDLDGSHMFLRFSHVIQLSLLYLCLTLKTSDNETTWKNVKKWVADSGLTKKGRFQRAPWLWVLWAVQVAVQDLVPPWVQRS